MVFIFITIGFFTILFFTSLSIIRILNRIKLKSSLKNTKQNPAGDTYIPTLQKLVQNDPTDTESRIRLIKAFLQIKNYSEAIVHLNNILMHDKMFDTTKKKEIQGMLASCYISANEPEEAYKLYLIMRQSEPTEPSNYIQLARIDLQRGQKERAAKYFIKAISLDPNNITILKELGILLYESDKFTESFSIFRKAASQKNNDPEINYYLAKLYMQFDKLQPAYTFFLRARSDKRFAVDSLIHIAKILKEYKKPDESLKIYALLLKNPQIKRDTILEIRYEIAENFLIKKKLQKAIIQWENILSHVSNYRDVREKLEQYEQTKTNSLLRNYMMAPKSEFVKLCKKLANSFTKNVVIIRTQPYPDSSVELFVQAIYKDAPTTIYFKFFRGNSNVGQHIIREFYERVKEIKAKRGVCFTTSGYSEDALTYSKGRVLELHDKTNLLKLLSKISYYQ